jgi:hypothetical protein
MLEKLVPPSPELPVLTEELPEYLSSSPDDLYNLVGSYYPKEGQTL